MVEFAELARGTLELADIPVGEGDLEVLAMINQAFDPAMRALDDADLNALPLEPDLDPGRPPRPRPTA
jgi:hypothetical protein